MNIKTLFFYYEGRSFYDRYIGTKRIYFCNGVVIDARTFDACRSKRAALYQELIDSGLSLKEAYSTIEKKHRPQHTNCN